MKKRRYIETEAGKNSVIRLIMEHPLPMTVVIDEGRPGTHDQDKLLFMWFDEVSQQMGDHTIEDLRAYCKLKFGAQILCNDDEEYRLAFNRTIRVLPYEAQISIMSKPIDYPVSRFMSTKQKYLYTEMIHDHYSGLGFYMTAPKRKER